MPNVCICKNSIQLKYYESFGHMYKKFLAFPIQLISNLRSLYIEYYIHVKVNNLPVLYLVLLAAAGSGLLSL